MDRLGEIHQLLIPLPGYTITINLEVLVMTAVVFFLALTFGFTVSRKKSMPPGRFQIIGELIVVTFYGLTEEAFGATPCQKIRPVDLRPVYLPSLIQLAGYSAPSRRTHARSEYTA